VPAIPGAGNIANIIKNAVTNNFIYSFLRI